MKSKYFLRTVAAALLIVMLIPLISGCADSANAEKVKVDNVFKTTSIPLPEDFQPSGEMNFINNKVYLQGYSRKDYQNTLYSINKDGSDGKFTKLKTSGNNSYINKISIMPDGNIVYLYNDYSYDEVTFVSNDTHYLVIVDTNGNEILKLNLTETLKKPEDEYFSVYNFSVDTNGNIFLIADRKIIILDSECTYLFEIKMEDNVYIQKLLSTADGETYALYYDYSGDKGGAVVKKVDFAKKALGDELDVTRLPGQSLYSLMPSFDGVHDFFYSDGTSIFGYSNATKVNAEILNWINSDIDSSFSNTYYVVSADEIICSGFDYLRDKSELMLLERVPEEDVKEKYIIKFAVFGLGYDFRSYIIDFNRNNLDYRIVIEDYTKYSTDEDYMAGVTRMNIDITSGKIPDILLTNNNIPIESYVSKGVFADLNKYIDDDPEINRADYFENILKAAENNGKLYRLFSNFTIQTVVGKEKFFGNMDGWTLKEFNEFMKTQPKGIATFMDVTRTDMLRRYITMLIDEFVDVDTGKCSFDSEEFIAVLEFCNTFTDDYGYDYMDPDFDYESYWRDRESSYKEDRTLLMDYYIHGFDYIWDLVKIQFDDDITFIGMPTPNRKGSSFYTTNEFAISAKTKHPEGVWSFLRQFIMDEYLEKNTYGGLPIKKSLVEKMAENALNPPEQENDMGIMSYYKGEAQGIMVYDGVEVVEEENIIEEAPAVVEAPAVAEPYYYNRNIRYIDGVEVDIGNITRKYTDMIIDVIEKVDNISRYDEEMINIITEEAESYFNGQKSAAETAKIIQNRLQNYVDEKR